jgi:glycosyltransferase involved in cell wall biosynthesis
MGAKKEMKINNNHYVSIIVPFLNESQGIKTTIASICDFCNDNPLLKFELVFVDDGSTDDSIKKIKESNFRGIKSKIVKLSRNYGSHAALRAGILNAEGDYLTFVYADLQDPLKNVLNLYNKCCEGYQIVWGFRESIDEKFIVKLSSKYYSYIMRKYAISNFPKINFDIVMFHNKIKSIIDKTVESNSNLFLQIFTLGFKQSFITYSKESRKFGTSKWTFSKKIKLFIDSFVAFSYTPIRFVTIIGILFSVTGFFWTMYVVIRTLLLSDLPRGWPALISVLLIGFGITNISLGIVAEYLWRTLDASRKRPVFIIDEIIELNK